MDFIKCLFTQTYEDGSKIFLLNYVNDMLYYGMNISRIQQFEKALGERFNLESLGNALWYLGSHI